MTFNFVRPLGLFGSAGKKASKMKGRKTNSMNCFCIFSMAWWFSRFIYTNSMGNVSNAVRKVVCFNLHKSSLLVLEKFAKFNKFLDIKWA